MDGREEVCGREGVEKMISRREGGVQRKYMEGWEGVYRREGPGKDD